MTFQHMLFCSLADYSIAILQCHINSTYHSSEGIELICIMACIVRLLPSHRDIRQFSFGKTTICNQPAGPLCKVSRLQDISPE